MPWLGHSANIDVHGARDADDLRAKGVSVIVSTTEETSKRKTHHVSCARGVHGSRGEHLIPLPRALETQGPARRRRALCPAFRPRKRGLLRPNCERKGGMVSALHSPGSDTTQTLTGVRPRYRVAGEQGDSGSRGASQQSASVREDRVLRQRELRQWTTGRREKTS